MKFRLSILLASTIMLGWLGTVSAQEVEYSIETETFFEDEPAWLLGLRPAVGWSGDGQVFPRMSLVLGRVFADHLYLGVQTGGRLTGKYHVQGGFRSGVLYRSLFMDFATGTSLGLLAMPESQAFGVVPTWWAETRLRVSKSHFLTLHAEVDLLFGPLGFHRDEALPATGIGWSILF